MHKLLLKSPYLLGDLLAVLFVAVIVGSGSLVHAAELGDASPHAATSGTAASQPAAASAAALSANDLADSWFAAARAGRTDILDAMIAAKFPIDATTAQGYTAVTLSAYNHQPAALALLLQRGANACLADTRGNTALMGALFKGDAEIATTLMATACNIDQVNNAGETAAAFATMFGRLDMLAALRAHGADLDHTDARGHSLLALAIEQRNDSAADALRKLGVKQ